MLLTGLVYAPIRSSPYATGIQFAKLITAGLPVLLI
jgi:hypothetical protein